MVSHNRAAWSQGKLLNLRVPQFPSLGCEDNTAVSSDMLEQR